MAPGCVIVLLMVCSAASAQSGIENRIANLNPAEPIEYKLLAEELAARTGDEKSRTTALRLFHSAAWLDPEGLGPGSLRSMIALARSPEEEKRFRAALYLLDPSAEPDALPRIPPAKKSGTGEPPAELLHALRQLRQTGRDAARASLAAPAVREFLAAEANRPLRDELQALFTASRLSDTQLRRLLELELTWTRQSNPSPLAPLPQASAQPWSELSKEALATPARSATLLDLTEFDPRGASRQ